MKKNYFITAVVMLLSLVAYSQTAKEHYEAGLTKAKLQKYEEAIVDYSKAIEIDPNHADAYYNRGIAKVRSNDYDSAMTDYNRAIEINPNFANAYYDRGFLRIMLSQTKEACSDLSKAMELGLKGDFRIIATRNMKEFCK